MRIHVSKISPTGAIDFTLTADNESERSILTCLTSGNVWPAFKVGGCSHACGIGTTHLILQQQERIASGAEHHENDAYIMARARNNADAPYDQETCRKYPWAAAARIAFLEGVVAAIKDG